MHAFNPETLAPHNARREVRSSPFHVHELIEIGGSRGSVVDMSTEGVRVRLTRRPQAHEELRIWIDMPDLVERGPRLRVTGRCVWVRDTDIGDEWDVGVELDRPIRLSSDLFWSA